MLAMNTCYKLNHIFILISIEDLSYVGGEWITELEIQPIQIGKNFVRYK